MSKKRKSTILPIFKYVTMIAIFITIGYSCSSDQTDVWEDSTPTSSSKAITEFFFPGLGIKGTINESTHIISVPFSANTDISDLAANFTTTGVKVSVGSVTQVSGTTKNDFSKAITYTVTAQDGSTQDYTIAPPNSADVLGFVFDGSDEPYWELPALKEGTNTFNNAPADLEYSVGYPILAAGATVTQSGGDEASDYNSTGYTFTVTAADGKTKKTYTVKIPAYNKDTNPYGIYTPVQLWTPNLHLTESFKVMNDITMPAVDGTEYPIGENYDSEGWSCIGDFYTFMGTIDGDGHVIKNLTIKRSSTKYIGFISVMGAKAVLKNIGFTSVNITGGATVGALVADNQGGTISHCYATGSVTSSGFSLAGQAGGLVGINNDANGKAGKMFNCYSKVNVTAGNGAVAGGLVGYNYSCEVQNCYATGSVSGTYESGGALIGKNASTVSNCYATGSLKTGGGLVGLNFYWSYTPDCFWDTQTTGQTTSDDGGEGIGKTTANMQTATPYTNTWTAANWKFTAGQYPTLVGLAGQ